MECNVCKNKALSFCVGPIYDAEYGAEGEYSLLKCEECGVLILKPMPTKRELEKAYPPHYHGFHTTSNKIISSLYSIVNHLRIKEYIKALPKNGKLLDVGSADAPYFDLVKKTRPDVECIGIEMIDYIAERGRKQGRNIVTGYLADLSSKKHGRFNLIIMNNLIEHVLDPVEELKHASSLLENNGKVIIETPNTDSWDFVVGNKYWGGCHVPRHTFLFSPKSMDKLAQLSGLQVEKFAFQLNTDHWALTVQNYLQRKTKILRFNLYHGRAVYYKYLLFAFIPINLLQLILRKTGSFKIILIK